MAAVAERGNVEFLSGENREELAKELRDAFPDADRMFVGDREGALDKFEEFAQEADDA